MNILLNIPEDVVGKFQTEADLEKRSRKNLMEKVLIDHFNLTPAQQPYQEPKKQFQEQYPPQKVNQFQAYGEEIKATTYSGDLQKLMKVVKADTSIAVWQQKQLEAFAIEHAKTFI